jgi:hypothetical protein
MCTVDKRYVIGYVGNSGVIYYVRGVKSVSTEISGAKLFLNENEAIKWYTKKYVKIKARANFGKWGETFGIDIDKPELYERCMPLGPRVVYTSMEVES